jgi:parvulin-like peptidyl-prolyl isomerase
MKHLEIISVTLIVSVLMTVTTYAAIVDRIVAIVNHDVITLSELDKNVNSYMKRIEKTVPEDQLDAIEKHVRQMVLNELIDQRLITQEAKKRGLMATDRDVNDAITNIITQRKITHEKLQYEIEQLGITFDEYREEVRAQLTKRNFLAGEIKSKITISKEEIGAYYREHRKDYEGKEAARIRQILILLPRDAADQTREKLRMRAEDILQRLRQGDSFSMLATEVSQGPAAKTGGDLGFVEKGLMLPDVDAAAFSLKIGEISDVIESPIGFHIIQVVDKRGEGVKPIESVREEIIGRIGDEKMENKFEEWLNEQREKAHIEVKL